MDTNAQRLSTAAINAPRARGQRRWVLIPAAMAVSVAVAVSALATPPRNSTAPTIKLNDLNGIEVSTADLAPRILILIFGTLPHEGVQRACTQVFDVVHDRRLLGDVVVPILIVPDLTVAHPRTTDEMPSRFPAITLHDPDRDSFGAYKVLVVPTVIVVGPRGQIVHSIAGFNPRFREILTASLLYAAGRESPREFERIVDAKVQQTGASAMRAARLTQMGDELMQAGLFGWAASRYSEACLLDPQNTAAALGAGAAMLRLRQLDDAQEKFTAVLTWTTECPEAELGLAEVELRRGGDTARAEAQVRQVIDASPTYAAAHMLLGEILEKRGDTAGASASFRRAAELALGQTARE